LAGRKRRVGKVVQIREGGKMQPEGKTDCGQIINQPARGAGDLGRSRGESWGGEKKVEGAVWVRKKSFKGYSRTCVGRANLERKNQTRRGGENLMDIRAGVGLRRVTCPLKKASGEGEGLVKASFGRGGFGSSAGTERKASPSLKRQAGKERGEHTRAEKGLTVGAAERGGRG